MVNYFYSFSLFKSLFPPLHRIVTNRSHFVNSAQKSPHIFLHSKLMNKILILFSSPLTAEYLPYFPEKFTHFRDFAPFLYSVANYWHFSLNPGLSKTAHFTSPSKTIRCPLSPSYSRHSHHATHNKTPSYSIHCRSIIVHNAKSQAPSLFFLTFKKILMIQPIAF